MKKLHSLIFTVCAICAATPSFAQDSEGTVSYALPQTTIVFNVEARQDVFYAGPFAKYSAKYLGVEAQQEDKTTFTIVSVVVNPVIEADQSHRYSVALPKGTSSTFLQMTSQGLVSGQEGAFSGAVWKYPAERKSDFVHKGLPANLTTASNTLYAKGMESVSQSVVVEKSVEKKAQEMAEKIFKIREQRYKILIGDTDATYSGEAMKAAVDALEKMEQDYITLFVGYTVSGIQTGTFEVTPKIDAKNQLYVAFRMSEKDGLQSADNVSGKPFYLELKPETPASPESPAKGTKPEQEIRYRVPAICTARLLDGVNSLFQIRIPVYQLGFTTSYPLNRK